MIPSHTPQCASWFHSQRDALPAYENLHYYNTVLILPSQQSVPFPLAHRTGFLTPRLFTHWVPGHFKQTIFLLRSVLWATPGSALLALALRITSDGALGLYGMPEIDTGWVSTFHYLSKPGLP